jgi:hypothetical protein
MRGICQTLSGAARCISLKAAALIICPSRYISGAYRGIFPDIKTLVARIHQAFIQHSGSAYLLLKVIVLRPSDASKGLGGIVKLVRLMPKRVIWR